MHPVEKQEQDVEGKSQASKDHATDQETVAALSLEYLPKGKTQRYRPSKPPTEMYWRKRLLGPLAGFLVKLRTITPIDRNLGSRDVLALFQGYVSRGDRNPALWQGWDPVTPAVPFSSMSGTFRKTSLSPLKLQSH